MITDLSQKVRSAYVWTFTGNLVRQLLSFGLSMLLARFLTPKDYGLAAIVAIFVSILSAMQDAGIGQAVIYFGEEADVPTVYTVSTAAGLLFSALLFVSAQPIAALYHSPQLMPVVQWMSLALVLGGLRSVSQALVTKSLRFQTIAAVESAGALAASGCAVFLAWKGFGVWSIVVNVLLSSALTTAMMLIAAPPRFTLHPDYQLVKKLVRWGLPLTGSSLLWNFYDNSDDLVVGRITNAQQLGFYTLAFRIATLVNERINAVIGRVSFPAFAAMREDRRRVVSHWLTVTRMSALLCFPALVMLGICAEDFVLVVLGPKWLPAVGVLRLLCLVAGIRILTPVVINLLPALGKTGLAFQYTLLNAVVMPASFAVGCWIGGIRGVAIAWVAVFPFLAAKLIWTALRLTQTSWSTYLRNLRVPILCAATVAVLMLPFALLQGPGLVRLLTLSIGGGIGLAAWVYWEFVRKRPFNQTTAPYPDGAVPVLAQALPDPVHSPAAVL